MKMTRRTFFSRLLVGLLVAPVIAKVIREPKPLIYFSPTDYMRAATFDGPTTYYYVSAADWPPAEIRGDLDIVVRAAPSR